VLRFCNGQKRIRKPACVERLLYDYRNDTSGAMDTVTFDYHYDVPVNYIDYRYENRWDNILSDNLKTVRRTPITLFLFYFIPSYVYDVSNV